MKEIYSLPLLALILSGCMMAARPDGSVAVVPFLPAIVEVDFDSHYEHGGYHYFYDNDRWFYSNSFGGPRRALPRSQWPKETRRRGGNPHR